MSPDVNPNKLPAPARGKTRPKSGPGKGGNSVVLEMLASRMAELDRQPNEEALIVQLERLEANAGQPRQIHDDERDRELAADIGARGLLQPIVVRPLKSGRYQIVAGERRFRAARLAGLAEVPVIVKQYDDEQARYASLVENLQRLDLDPLDEGRYFDLLNVQENISVRDIAAYIHRSHHYVQERLNRYRANLGAGAVAAEPDKAPGPDSEEDHKRNEKLHKLQNSQPNRTVRLKNVGRFRDFLADTRQRVEELKPAERLNLADQLRELRQQIEAFETELLKDRP